MRPVSVEQLIEAGELDPDPACAHPASMWHCCHRCVMTKVRYAVRLELAAEQDRLAGAIADVLAGRMEPRMTDGAVSVSPLLTIQEAAGVLQVSKSTVYQLVTDGELCPLEGLDRPMRFSVDAVQEFIDRRDPVGARRRARDQRKAAGGRPARVSPIRGVAAS